MAAITLVGCDGHLDETASWEIEREGIELAQRLKLAEYRLGRISPGDLAESGRWEGEVRATGEKLRTLKQIRLSLSIEIKEMAARNDELCQTAIRNQRTKSMALKFESFSVKDGRTFRNVSVTGVDDAGVAIRHEDGAARLRYADLSAEHRALFGLEEEAALAAEAREHREALAYERGIDLEMQAVRERDQLAAAVTQRNNDSRASRSLLAASPSPSRESGMLSRPATPFGTGSIYRRYGDSGYRSYQPNYRYVYYYPSTPNPFCSSHVYRSVGSNGVAYPRVSRPANTPSMFPANSN